MVKQNEISLWVKQPNSIQESDNQILKNLVSEYPWCSSYHVLLAKGYANENSYLQNNQLRLASTYAGSRSALFSFFHTDSQKTDSIDAETSDIQSDIQKEKDVPKEELVKVAKEKNGVKKPKKVIKSTEESQNNSKENKSHKPHKTVILSEKHPIDFEKIITYDPIKELKVKEHTIATQPRIPLEQPIYNPEKELAKFIEEESSESNQDFIYWLNQVGKKSEPKKEKKKINSPDRVQILLDEFIKTKRSRPIQNRSFYNAQDKAEASEKDAMHIISETLINIYIKQGHYEKAIQGFEKLSLQNPEKSAYFAARIKEVKLTKNDL